MRLLSTIRQIFTLIVTAILMSSRSQSGSVPVTWLKSSFFNSGQFVHTPTSSGTTISVSTTYSPSLTGPPAKKPSLAITDMSHQFSLPSVYLRIDLAGFTQTGLTVSVVVTYGSTFSMKIYYLAPDPTMTYQYSSFSWSASGPYTGPFAIQQVLGISGLTGSGLNMSHEVTMLPFINGFNLTSSTYCFQLILRTRVYDSTHYQMNFTSSCTGMVASFIGWSRIIFDITAIEDLGYCFFQYGTYTALNNDGSTLNILLKPFIAENFLLGISQLKYTSPTAPIIMSFNTTLANLVQTTSHTVFERLAFTYWSLKYRYCPPAYPYFHLPTETCYDLCDSGTYYNAATAMCKDCFYTCKTCSAYPACSDCNSSDNRYLYGTSCLPNAGYFDNGTAYAPACTPHCIDCTNLTVCIACDTGYIINGSSLCESVCMQGCTICPNMSVCTVCDTANGYYLVGSDCQYCNSTTDNFINMTNLQCEPCTLTACTDCYSLTICNTCNTTANYAIEGVVCDYCNNTLNEFINSTLLCENCSQPGCITCLSLTTCSLCNISESYYLANSTCQYCNSTNNFFINTTNVQCELCSLNQCIQCASLTQCSVCNTTANYYLLDQACQYCNNSLNNFINSTYQCETCSIEGCITCSSLTTCSLCDTNNNYYTLGLVCGYCNNSLNYFINSSTLLCDLCTLSNCIVCNDLLTCNLCNQTAGFFPNSFSLCEPCQLQGCIECSSLSTCKVCDSALQYSLSSSKTCNRCNGCKCYSDKPLPDPVPSIEYSEQECRNFERTDFALYAIAIASFSVMILASFTTCLIGIELIGVLQLAFLNMGDNLFVHLYLGPILSWYYVNGYNIKPTEFQAVPPNIQQIGYTSGFLNNVNVMFGVLLLSTILLIVSEILARNFQFKFPKASKVRTIVRQIYMATYLFNSLNISFSLGLQYQYFRLADMGLNMYSLSVVCSCLVIVLYLGAVIWLTFSTKLKCGEYTERFKGDCLNQLYIPITILYRFALGIYMSTGNESDNSTLLILAISFSFILFNIINLSYNKFYHNYRANISHLSQLVILIVTNYYRSIKKNSPIEVKALINTPAFLEIACIFLCVAVAVLNGLYQIVMKIKSLKKGEKVVNNEQVHPTQQSIDNPCIDDMNQKNTQTNHMRNQSNHQFSIHGQYTD